MADNLKRNLVLAKARLDFYIVAGINARLNYVAFLHLYRNN